MNFCNFFNVDENNVFGKNWGYSRANISWITRTILVCDMESCDKNI